LLDAGWPLPASCGEARDDPSSRLYDKQITSPSIPTTKPVRAALHQRYPLKSCAVVVKFLTDLVTLFVRSHGWGFRRPTRTSCRPRRSHSIRSAPGRRRITSPGSDRCGLKSVQPSLMQSTTPRRLYVAITRLGEIPHQGAGRRRATRPSTLRTRSLVGARRLNDAKPTGPHST